MSLCCSIVILKVISSTHVQSVEPYNLKVEQTGNDEPSREQLPWLVSWLIQTTNRMRRSQRTDREIPRQYHDIVAEFVSHDITIQEIPMIQALIVTMEGE